MTHTSDREHISYSFVYGVVPARNVAKDGFFVEFFRSMIVTLAVAACAVGMTMAVTSPMDNVVYPNTEVGVSTPRNAETFAGRIITAPPRGIDPGFYHPGHVDDVTGSDAQSNKGKCTPAEENCSSEAPAPRRFQQRPPIKTLIHVRLPDSPVHRRSRHHKSLRLHHLLLPGRRRRSATAQHAVPMEQLASFRSSLRSVQLMPQTLRK